MIGLFLCAVYGEIHNVRRMEVTGLRTSDVTVGIYFTVIGANSVNHALVDKTVHVSDTLMVGFSKNGNCDDSKPSLHTCSDSRAYCWHVGPGVSIKLHG